MRLPRRLELPPYRFPTTMITLTSHTLKSKGPPFSALTPLSGHTSFLPRRHSARQRTTTSSLDHNYKHRTTPLGKPLSVCDLDNGGTNWMHACIKALGSTLQTLINKYFDSSRYPQKPQLEDLDRALFLHTHLLLCARHPIALAIALCTSKYPDLCQRT